MLTFSSLISGPAPLISVPSIDLSLRLILEIPFSIEIKSDLIPMSFNLLTISFPVKPATKPRAVLSNPKFFKTVDTLVPLPPGKINSELVRLVSPNLKSSTDTM